MDEKNNITKRYENVDFFITEFHRILKEKQVANNQEKPEKCSENSELT